MLPNSLGQGHIFWSYAPLCYSDKASEGDTHAQLNKNQKTANIISMCIFE